MATIHYRGEDGVYGYGEGDILVNDSTGDRSRVVHDARGLVLVPITIARDVIAEIEAAQAELGTEAYLWAQPSQGDVRLFRGELTAGNDGAYPERSWKLDPETMAEAVDSILFDEIM